MFISHSIWGSFIAIVLQSNVLNRFAKKDSCTTILIDFNSFVAIQNAADEIVPQSILFLFLLSQYLSSSIVLNNVMTSNGIKTQEFRVWQTKPQTIDKIRSWTILIESLHICVKIILEFDYFKWIYSSILNKKPFLFELKVDTHTHTYISTRTDFLSFTPKLTGQIRYIILTFYDWITPRFFILFSLLPCIVLLVYG